MRAGSLRLDGGAMFGLIPKTMWSKLSNPDDLNRILLQTNCVLLENDDASRKVVIETGFGNKFDKKARGIFSMEDRWISDALNEVNVDRYDITDIILTHLHFDHAGGLTYYDYANDKCDIKTPLPAFPKADIYVQRTEWEDLQNKKTTMSSKFMPEHLDKVAGCLQFVEGEAELLPGISVLPVPGHTWGQQAVLFNTEAGKIVYPGDLLPTANHVGLHANMAFDVEPYTNMQTKRVLLETCIENGWKIILAHEPGQPLYTVERDARKPDSYSLLEVVG